VIAFNVISACRPKGMYNCANNWQFSVLERTIAKRRSVCLSVRLYVTLVIYALRGSTFQVIEINFTPYHTATFLVSLRFPYMPFSAFPVLQCGAAFYSLAFSDPAFLTVPVSPVPLHTWNSLPPTFRDPSLTHTMVYRVILQSLWNTTTVPLW